MNESQIVMQNLKSVSDLKYVLAMQNLEAKQVQMDTQAKLAQQTIKSDLQTMKSNL